MVFARSFRRVGVTAAGVVKLLAEALIAERRMIRCASGAEVRFSWRSLGLGTQKNESIGWWCVCAH
jgi:hypothetical protein